MEDEKRSIIAIFWLVVAFAFSVTVLSVGAAWAFLEWIGYLESGQVMPALLVVGVGVLGTLTSLVGIIVWLVREARR